MAELEGRIEETGEFRNHKMHTVIRHGRSSGNPATSLFRCIPDGIWDSQLSQAEGFKGMHSMLFVVGQVAFGPNETNDNSPLGTHRCNISSAA